MSGRPPVGIVAGTGMALDCLLDTVRWRRAFRDIPGLEPSGVAGHGSVFILGAAGSCPVLLQCGRRHFYEGLDYESVVAPVDAMHGFGVRTVLFTNAAGGLLPAMRPGDLMAAKGVDLWPFVRWFGRPETLAVDFVVPGCEFAGAYAWVPGPCYETRAEVRALQILGAGAVGMSTAPELARCRALGMQGGVVSCITNSCSRPQPLTHRQVIEAARGSSRKLVGVIRRALPRLLVL
ncbi:MAG TPA: purine-nucleoside phosphorylase [Candidatus Hydrogenedentes bacterium]|nr:purine-nucleoside phosphorylase [Candidatus Hydrogenedentota bacterium]HIJ74729.1 purine-nucleoside phosphorylase [Candidatus Hydrogenedentota bacterium]